MPQNIKRYEGVGHSLTQTIYRDMVILRENIFNIAEHINVARTDCAKSVQFDGLLPTKVSHNDIEKHAGSCLRHYDYSCGGSYVFEMTVTKERFVNDVYDNCDAKCLASKMPQIMADASAALSIDEEQEFLNFASVAAADISAGIDLGQNWYEILEDAIEKQMDINYEEMGDFALSRSSINIYINQSVITGLRKKGYQCCPLEGFAGVDALANLLGVNRVYPIGRKMPVDAAIILTFPDVGVYMTRCEYGLTSDQVKTLDTMPVSQIMMVEEYSFDSLAFPTGGTKEGGIAQVTFSAKITESGLGEPAIQINDVVEVPAGTTLDQAYLVDNAGLKTVNMTGTVTFAFEPELDSFDVNTDTEAMITVTATNGTVSDSERFQLRINTEEGE